jgi:O-antigen ligase
LHHPVWQFTAENLSLPLKSRISINPDGALNGLMNILTYWSIGWVGLILGIRQRTADIILKTLIVTGCCYALYGIIIYFSGNNTILVYEKWTYHTSLTSTFVNRNSYATYAGLILLLSLGYICQRIKSTTHVSQSFSIKFKALIEFLFQHQLWPIMGALLLITSLALTVSRAGTLSSLIALMVLILFLFKHNQTSQEKTNWFVFAAVLVATVLMFILSAGQLGTRVESMLNSTTTQGRWDAYLLTLQIIADTPLLGMGLGGFEDVFQHYRRNTLRSPVLWAKAHNTYLELVLELGIPVALLYFTAIALFIRSVFNGITQRRSGKLYPIIGFSAALLVCLHSLLDFSLQIPAVSVTFAAILGVSVAQSTRKQERGHHFKTSRVK